MQDSGVREQLKGNCNAVLRLDCFTHVLEQVALALQLDVPASKAGMLRPLISIFLIVKPVPCLMSANHNLNNPLTCTKSQFCCLDLHSELGALLHMLMCEGKSYIM